MSSAVQRDFDVQSPTLDSGPDLWTLKQFRLEVIEGPDVGKSFVSTGTSVSIGSDPDADLQLSDMKVAAFQCELLATENGIDIIALAERQGTLVNDLEISKAHLRRPVVITIGQTKIRFERISANLHMHRSRELSFATLIGSSIAMRELFSELTRIASSEEPVLVEGEAGTGKALVAHAIHVQGRRRSGVFNVVDCAAPHHEIERGLMSGFENSAGGTLYLKHIADMPLDLQSRLLRVFRNGGPAAVADLRIISSSSVDLRLAVNCGRFDSRLYGHLRREKVRVPAMRERSADLPRLVSSLLEEIGVSTDPLAEELCSQESLERMQRYPWPGNARELREHLNRCIRHNGVLPAGQVAANVNQSPEDGATVSPEVDISRPIKAGREEWIKHFERMYLADILESEGGNVTRAAKAAGVDRGHFYRLMLRSGLRTSS